MAIGRNFKKGRFFDNNGEELILDVDGDTSITADTDDQIDIKIAGADDFKFTANNMNVLSGSTLTIDSGATITNSGTATGFGTDLPTVRPLLINGDMAIAQRGTSTSSASTDNYFAADRWRTNIDSYGAYTISQSTTVPSGQGFAKSFKIDCTTADGSPAAGDLFTFEQRCEGQMFQVMKKGTSNAEKTTLAFWIRSNLTGNFTVNLVDSDNSRRVGALVTISDANTWEKKVINFPADTTGALDNDANDSFRIQFFLGAGSNFTSGTLPSTWESATTANFAAGQTAFIGSSTSNELYITGLQFEIGEYTSASLPPFRHEPVDENLTRCQRYFIGSSKLVSTAQATGATSGQSLPQFRTEMRASPTAAHVATGGFGLVGGSFTTTSLGATSLGANGGRIVFNHDSSLSTLQFIQVGQPCTLSAEL
tara:strand:+ start:4638 stop:5909 length:1272 start_codon:yes stop_codon:yes gene_type:complete